jgi:hypothetical protein
MRRAWLAAAALAVVLPSSPAGATTGLDHAYLYLQGSRHQSFVVRQTATATTVTAPATNTNTNVREAIWSPSGPAVQDEQTCTSFTSSSTYSQEGLALRIAQHGKYLDMLTLTKNVWGKPSTAGANWVFNVSWWINRPGGKTDYARIGWFDESAEVGGENGVPLAPEPWSMCASVTGATFAVLVWPTANPEPAWSTAKTLTLPAKWVYRGRTGLYAGHVHPGDEITYTSQEAPS